MPDPIVGAMNAVSPGWGTGTTQAWRKMTRWSLALYPCITLLLVLLFGLPKMPWPTQDMAFITSYLQQEGVPVSALYWVWLAFAWGLGYFCFVGWVKLQKNRNHAAAYRAIRQFYADLCVAWPKADLGELPPIFDEE